MVDMPQSPDVLFCELDGCTREPLPYSRFCQFCQKKGAQLDYTRQAQAHRHAIQARRDRNVAPDPYDLLFSFCSPSGPRSTGSTLTYAIGVHSYVKFGHARNVEGRLINLQVGTPYRLRLLATINSSPQLHYYLQHYLAAHLYRGAWFRLNEVTQTFVRLMMLNDLSGICRQLSILSEGAPLEHPNHVDVPELV